YRAVDSAGATIDFLLAGRRDAAAARRFRTALLAPGHPRPRVINVDGNPSYPKVVAELKQERKLGRRCRGLALLEQQRGTGSSSDQTTGQRQPGFPILSRRPADNPRIRGSAHDPERPGEVVAQRGCAGIDSVPQ